MGDSRQGKNRMRKGFSDVQQVKAARGIVLLDGNSLTEV